MHISFSFSESLDDWLFTPPVQLEAGSQYELSFWYKTTEFPGENTSEKLEVKMGTDNTSEAMNGDAVFFDVLINKTRGCSILFGQPLF